MTLSTFFKQKKVVLLLMVGFLTMELFTQSLIKEKFLILHSLVNPFLSSV